MRRLGTIKGEDVEGMTTRAWTWIAAMAALVGLLGAAALGVAVGEAPAGNRDPEPKIFEFPGPEQVTFGENVAYTATLFNGPNLSSNFTHVTYRHKVPVTTLGGLPTPAELIYASCDPDRTTWVPDRDDFYTCPEIAQLPAGATARILLVFRTPGNPDGVGDNVTCGASNSCVLTSNGYWIIKEGTGKPGSSGPDTFPPLDQPLTVTTDLLGAAPDLTKARGYVLDECAGSSLETSTSVPVGPDNRVQTEVCATSVPGSDEFPTNPGLLIHIDELPTTAPMPVPSGFAKRITEGSFICMPEPEPDLPPTDPFGKCPATPGYFDVGYDPWSFDEPAPGIQQGTFTFTIDNTTLPKGEKIDAVYHNGVFVPFCSASPGADPCVVSIVVNNKLKITIVTVRSSEQGGWDFI
jgi:hypothetical protein